MRRALLRAGGGMIQASTSLLFGFLILMFSEFEAQFGFLLSFSQAVALVYDLAFVPAGLALWGPKGEDGSSRRQVGDGLT